MSTEPLWAEVGRKCLERAKEILDKETSLTCEEVSEAGRLIDCAVAMDLQNLRWEERSLSCAEGQTGRLLGWRVGGERE